MPRRSQGTRLYLQPARDARADKPAEPAVWVIRDGPIKRSTGAGASDIGRAETALTAYLNRKATPRPSNRDPDSIFIADVISIYAEDVAKKKHADPDATASRLENVVEFFEGKTLAYLNNETCEAYAEWRGKAPSARRELEDLRAAVRHHWRRGLCSGLTPIVLPERGLPREEWLTRDKAAHLIWTAWRLRQKWRGKRTDRRIAQHVARFILAGLYMGLRRGALSTTALKPTPGKPWLDLDYGVFYGRRAGGRKSKKRQPTMRVSPRFLTHARRWHRLNLSRRFLIEYGHQPVKKINKAFRSVVKAAGLPRTVTPHTLRHTAITWQAQLGVDPYEICGYFKITLEVFEDVYAHHHPDCQQNAVNALSRPRRKPDRMDGTERERIASNIIALAGK